MHFERHIGTELFFPTHLNEGGRSKMRYKKVTHTHQSSNAKHINCGITKYVMHMYRPNENNNYSKKKNAIKTMRFTGSIHGLFGACGPLAQN